MSSLSKALGELDLQEPYQNITDNQYCLLHISTDLPFRDLLVKCIFICMLTYFFSCEIYKGNDSIDCLTEVVTVQQKMIYGGLYSISVQCLHLKVRHRLCSAQFTKSNYISYRLFANKGRLAYHYM